MVTKIDEEVLTMSKRRNSVLGKILHVIVGFFISIICLVLVVLIVFNVAKFPIYSTFYSVREDICNIPGLNDNFIPQGIASSEENEIFIVSGYMKDHSSSRIYVTNKDNESHYVKLTKNDLPFTGHCGGIATTGNKVFIASSERIFTISIDDILGDNEFVDIGDGIEVNNSASFVFSNDDYLYVGEFHDGGKYVTNHYYKTNEGDHYAIVSKYSLNDLTQPLEIYSIRNKVQGFAITEEGKIVLSTSYGLSSSHFYVYDETGLVDSKETFDGAPVYYLVNHVQDLKAPPMSEDLDIYDGKIITLTESACNKYIFGKFFFANKIFGLTL